MFIKSIFFLSLAIINFSAWSRLLVISDVDDTIKQSNVLSIRGSIGSIFPKAKDFDRLKKIFWQLSGNQETDFYYVSSSPNCFVNQALWLEKRGFPKGKVTQRNCSKLKNEILKDTYSFKLKQIDNFLKNYSGKYDQIIFFGDNAEKDEDIYLSIQEKYNLVESRIFIRDIRLQATRVDPDLKIVKKKNIDYFLTEYELILDPYFGFVSSELYSMIVNDFREYRLFPFYYLNNLVKRYEKELGIDDDDGKKRAKKQLENYVREN